MNTEDLLVAMHQQMLIRESIASTRLDHNPDGQTFSFDEPNPKPKSTT